MQCVETGVVTGWRRAHKHVEHPEEDALRDHIQEAVITEICEWFHLKPGYEENE